MSNINQFITEKKTNFCNYLLKLFPDDKEVKKQIDQYRFVDNSNFLLYVRNNVSPYKNNLDKYVIDQFQTFFKDETKKLKTEDINKLKRYLNMFIDLSK